MQWAAFDRRWELPPMDEAGEPVFILSCVWRTGSTLLQRVLSSSGELFLWGEPYPASMLIQNLYRSALAYRKDVPLVDDYFVRRMIAVDPDEFIQAPHMYWMANIYPDPLYFRSAQRVALEQLFGSSAQSHGFSRWGGKFVRLNGAHAEYLYWLFPDARFVYLTRNPYDAWNSYRGANWNYVWPNGMVRTAAQFAQIWKKNMVSFAENAFDATMMIRYEDFLKRDETYEKTLSHCRIENVEEKVFDIRIRGFQRPPGATSQNEVDQIRRICGSLAATYGYHGLGQSD